MQDKDKKLQDKSKVSGVLPVKDGWNEEVLEQYVAKQIRYYRQKQRITQKELGEALGVSFQQIQKYERGENRISAGRLFILAQALKVPYSLFLGYEQYDDFSLDSQYACWLSHMQNIKNPQSLSLLLRLTIHLAEECSGGNRSTVS